MRILLFEIKKTWATKRFLVLLLILLCVNLYKLNDYYQSDSSFALEGQELVGNAYFQLYNTRLAGEITSENLVYLRTQYNALSEQVRAGNFSTEHNANQLTGYVFGDYNLFADLLIPQYTYAYLYAETMYNTVKKAYENIDFYMQHHNFPEVKKSQQICFLYENRSIEEFRLTQWANAAIQYDFSSLTILFLLIYASVTSFSCEQEGGMTLLIQSTHKCKTVFYTKIISLCVLSALLIGIFTILDTIFFCSRYGYDGGFMPIYSVAQFQWTPLRCSILATILICAGLKLFSLIVVTLLSSLLLLRIRNPLAMISMLLVFYSALLFEKQFLQSMWNPLFLLSPAALFKTYQATIVFGFPVLSVFIAVGYTGVVLFLLAILGELMLKEGKCCAKI